MKKCLSILLILLTLLSLPMGCSSSLDREIEYIPYVIDETEDLSAPSFSDASATDGAISAPVDAAATSTSVTAPKIAEDGVYTSKDDVALYIYTYGKLPKNFISKKEAQALGWEGGSLEPYAPGKCIGGSRFGNYEGKLPEKKGRYYTECDIDTLGKSKRGSKRIVFSNDGLIYYTDDHYKTFMLLYGEE